MNENFPVHADRAHDVVVWGATGFTGRLVAEYLQQNYAGHARLKWAIAGRSRDKLEAVIAEIVGDGMPPDIIVADSNDAQSLLDMAAQTRVVLTTVGPYALYGDKLVEACVQAGTDYCDLSGEVQWMRRMIDAHQAAAEASGARIVHSCGFDSIPSDLGVQFLQEHALDTTGHPCKRVELLVRAMRGGGSGGTIASALQALKESSHDREVARILADPYSLNPEGERSGPDGRDQHTIRYSELGEVWTAPFVMALINNRNVRRSNALLDYPWGRDFSYGESIACGSGPVGWSKAAAVAASVAGMVLAGSFDFTRENLVRRLVPKPGEGPSAAERESGFFNLRLVGETADGGTLQARVTGDRDPGYGSTSKMLAESAVCLAKDPRSTGGGIWTPASAMGSVLRERLVKNAGLRFEIL
jgi:short subunit dehydrogenase-like uncharacterized protein